MNAALVARTVRLPSPPDLLAEAGASGLLWRGEEGGLVGQGTALDIDLPGGLANPDACDRVRSALAAIEVEDEVGRPGCGPVAMGALPFDPAASGRLVVPARIVGRLGEEGWVTTITGGPAAAAAAAAPARASELPPDEFTLTPSLAHADWMAVIAEAVEVLRRGDLDKVVLARRIDISANRAFVVPDVLERLVALYPSCMVFSVDGFIGASPELLISRLGDRIESHPLAGTVARSGDVHGDQALVAKLMSSPKARHEHQVVVDRLRQSLGDLCGDLTVPDEPSIMGLRNVSHLGTHITGRLAPAHAASTALDLVARIHPTPAVGGTPSDAAVRYMQKVEGFDRGRYAGPVGWVDYRGDGAWALGIRSAMVDGAQASIFAGNGIVAGSDPAEELAETQLKLQALLAALVRP